MPGYKVPQDVEADDKFLGPLSFKQFIFSGGAIVSGFVTYYCISIGLWPISIIFLPPFVFCAFLAFPWSKEQTTEVWLAARLRFMIKQRKRVWDQSGVKHLVTITAPIKPKHLYTDGLDQVEVRNRFTALANIVDSRGWAIKNSHHAFSDEPSDRLLAGTTKQRSELENIAANTTDLYDTENSPIARQFDTMINTSEQIHHSATIQMIDDARSGHEPTITKRNGYLATDPRTINPMTATIPAPMPASNAVSDEQYWIGQQAYAPAPVAAAPAPTLPPQMPPMQADPYPALQPAPINDPVNTVVPATDPVQADQASPQPQYVQQTAPTDPAPSVPFGNLPYIPQQPIYQPSPITQRLTQQNQHSNANTTLSRDDPVILELANTNHLDVATLSRQVNKKKPPEDEVVISLR